MTTVMKQMKMVGIDNIAQLHYIGSFRHMQPSRFLNSANTIVQNGQNKIAWQGNALIKGGNIELEKTISETAKRIDLYCEQYLPQGRLGDLCFRLNPDTTRWASKFIVYSNRELKEVANYGIPEVKTYTLLSDQWITVFTCFWPCRMLMQEFSGDCDLVMYVARAIYKTMQMHMIMDEFASADFKAHNLISSVFIRFLAEETGSNLFSSGLASKLKEILQELDELKKSVGKKSKGINRHLDSHTEHLKLICPTVDVKFKPLSNSDAEA